jgi:tRNA (uracil-5-)-methyltransferase
MLSLYLFCHICFGLGINEETGERTVGFRLGSYVQGFTGVGPVDCLRHIPDRLKEAAKVLKTYLKSRKSF